MNKSQQHIYYKTLLNNIGLCPSLKHFHDDAYNDFMELFKNHPEYPDKVKNVVDIAIVNNKLINKYFELQLIKNDGTTDDISYKKCIYKPSTNNSLKQAMRYAIKDQIFDYKDSCDELICEICGSEQNIQIDHVILFKQLYDCFLKQNTLIIPTTFDNTYFNSAKFKEFDKEFVNSWSNYHKKHAILRCLCNKCNQSRNKK
jgi:hypothetical protein